MKKLLTMIVASAAALAFADGARRPMALMIMVDGLRADAVETGEMPNLARLRDGSWASGYRTAWSLDGSIVANTASFPECRASSAPNHVSIATGFTPEKHGVYSNGNTANGDYATYPTWLKRVVDANAGVNALFVYCWSEDASLGPASGVTFLGGADEAANATALAARLASVDAPDATMYFIDAVDASGHGYGYFPMSDGYKTALATVDGYIGQCLAAIAGRATFAQEDWLILVTSDHGGYAKLHGEITYGRHADTVPFVISGRNVTPGRIPGQPRNYDVAASALAHFGVKVSGLDATRRDVTTIVDGGRALTDGLVAYLPFDSSTTANAAPGSSIAPTSGGSPTITSGGAIGSYCNFPNSRGNYVKLDGTDSESITYEGGNKCFAVTLWVKMSPPGGGDPAIVANKKWSPGYATGILLYAGYDKLSSFCNLTGYNGSVGLNVANGIVSQTTGRIDMGPMNYEDSSGWTFYAFTRNEDGVITFYQGRQDGTLDWISGELASFTMASGESFYIGNDASGNYGYPFVGGIDDFGLWKRPLTHDEIRKIYENGRNGVALGGLLTDGPATATWTGASSSNPADPSNWSGGAVPAANTAVTIAGTTARPPSAPDGKAISCASLFLDDVVLGSDACWRGFDAAKIASDSSIDLNGKSLMISAGTAASSCALAITDTSADTSRPGEFQLAVPAGETLSNASMAFSGNLRFAKYGAGVYASAESETYSGGVSIFGGSYRLSSVSSGNYSVAFDATLDQYGYSMENASVLLNGGTITSTRAVDTTFLPGMITQTADSSIVFANLSDNHDFALSAGAVWNLGGRTLDLIMDGKDPDFKVGDGGGDSYRTISNGTFRVTVKATALNGSNVGYCGWVQLARLDGRDGLDLDLGNSFLRLQGGTIDSRVCGFTYNPIVGSPYTVYSYVGRVLEVYGVYVPPSVSKGFNLKLMNGATLDLSSYDGVLSCQFNNDDGYAGGSDTDCKVAFADGATITVNLAGRGDIEEIADARGYVATWATNAKPAASTTFVLDAATASLPQSYRLHKDKTGLKLCKPTGAIIFVL